MEYLKTSVNPPSESPEHARNKVVSFAWQVSAHIFFWKRIASLNSLLWICKSNVYNDLFTLKQPVRTYTTLSSGAANLMIVKTD